MKARRIVRIDALPESTLRYAGCDAIVIVDVLLSATTIVTALSQGRRVFASSSARNVGWVRKRVENPVVVTDALDSRDTLRFGGPAWLATGDGRGRAIVHVSPLADMLSAAVPRARVYLACLRNLEATANEIALFHRDVVVLGAGERGEICSEDQMIAAWLARKLQDRGFELEGRNALEETERWGAGDASLVGLSRSAERLRARGRGADVDFVLCHLDDLPVVCGYADGEFRDPAEARRRLDEETPTPAWGTARPVLGH